MNVKVRIALVLLLSLACLMGVVSAYTSYSVDYPTNYGVSQSYAPSQYFGAIPSEDLGGYMSVSYSATYNDETVTGVIEDTWTGQMDSISVEETKPIGRAIVTMHFWSHMWP